MPEHSWKEWEFLPSAQYGNMTTCVQVWKCTKCDLREGLPMNIKPKPGDDCTEKKPAWVCPMPPKESKTRAEVEPKDYPAKRNGYEAKKRKR